MKLEEGIVVTVYEERGTVRVKRQENDGVISAELRVIFPGTLKNQRYSMPSIDEHVICLYPADGHKGYVIGAVYSDVTEPPIKNKKKHYIHFEDGAEFEYDTENHVLTIKSENVVVDGNIRCTGTITSGS